MSVDNILNIVQSLSEEPNKLSEDEEVDLYLYFTFNGSKLDNVEKLLNHCETNTYDLPDYHICQ